METFINNSITKAITDYLDSRDNIQGITYNSFLVVVIRMLILIYGELDIVNPYLNNNKELFIENLIKYRYPKDSLNLFFNKMDAYLEEEKVNELKEVKNKNIFFVDIQKMLIDMFVCKKIYFNITEEETVSFYELLYTPNTKNPLQLSYNYLNATDIKEIDNYFKRTMQDNVKVVASSEKHILNAKGYEILGYDIMNVINMDASEIDKINNQIYDYFKIRSNAINKEYLLEKAIDDYIREQNRITSGNGFVDTLLFLSILATVVMVTSIIVFVL